MSKRSGLTPCCPNSQFIQSPVDLQVGFPKTRRESARGSNAHHDTDIMYVGVKVIEASKLILFL